MNAVPTDTLLRGGSFVYRLFDQDDHLLYIGSTNSIDARMAEHRTRFWADSAVRLDVELFDSIEQARAAEKVAILAEMPVWNVKGYPRPLRRTATPSPAASHST